MFLPWFVWGIRSDNGWETNYYVVLACWFVPLFSAYNHNNWKVINIISLLIGSLAFVVFLGEGASVTILGDTYGSNVGAGAYVYLLAWSAAVYSELMISNGTYDANDISGNAVPASDNEELFLQVERDFEKDKIDEALWVKSLTMCDGNKDKAKFKYIRDKVSKLEQEIIKNNKIKKTTFSIVELKSFLRRLDVFSKAEVKTFLRRPDIYSNVETKDFPRPLGVAIAIVFGVVGFLLLTHWLLSHWFSTPGEGAPNIELIAWFVFTVISVRLGLVFGFFGDGALNTNRSVNGLTAKWFLLVTFATFISYLLVGALIGAVSWWLTSSG